MKKTIAVLWLAVCLLCFGGCGEKPAASLVDAETLRSQIQESQAFSEEMKTLSMTQLVRYLAIAEDAAMDAAMSIDASRSTPEAIVVLTASSADQVQSLEAAVKQYRDDILEQYRDYQPQEVPKLENAVIRAQGLQVVLAVGPDAAAAEKVLEDAWK